MIDDPQKICEAFNIHFATIGEKIGKSIKFHDSTPFSFPNSSTSFFFFGHARKNLLAYWRYKNEKSN